MRVPCLTTAKNSVQKVILHIGAGKCGSSALQQFLSENGSFVTEEGRSYVYGVLQSDGSVLTGADVRERALSSVFGYMPSASFTAADPVPFAGNFYNALKHIQCDVLVLSFEGWIYEAVEAGVCLHHINGIDAEVLMYIRPPVEWINSAWWQWGAWSDTSFSEWLDETIGKTHWHEFIQQWSAINVVSKTTVRLLPSDVVADFCDQHVIEYSPVDNARTNVSLSAALQRFLQNHRDLRPSPHVSRIEFSLSRHLPGGRSAWVIDTPYLNDILNKTREPNQCLRQWLAPAQYQRLEDDPAWWSEQHYDTRVIESPDVQPLSATEMDTLLYEAVNALHQAEADILSLKKEIRRLTA